MTDQEFSTQINRLAETYGKNAFSNERCKLIWSAVKDLPGQWFGNLVSSMIGSLRQAPLVPEFVDAAREYRNQLWEMKKREEREQTRNWVSRFSSDEERMLAQGIMKRLRGEMTDQDWENYERMLEGMAAMERRGV